jgi:hypothetical protein
MLVLQDQYGYRRGHIVAFLLAGAKLRLIVFNRGGACVSTPFDIAEQPRKFMCCVAGLLVLEDARLGYRSADNAESFTVTFDGAKYIVDRKPVVVPQSGMPAPRRKKKKKKDKKKEPCLMRVPTVQKRIPIVVDGNCPWAFGFFYAADPGRRDLLCPVIERAPSRIWQRYGWFRLRSVTRKARGLRLEQAGPCCA